MAQAHPISNLLPHVRFLNPDDKARELPQNIHRPPEYRELEHKSEARFPAHPVETAAALLPRELASRKVAHSAVAVNNAANDPDEIFFR